MLVWSRLCSDLFIAIAVVVLPPPSSVNATSSYVPVVALSLVIHVALQAPFFLLCFIA